MSEKQFYVCLLEFEGGEGGKPHRSFGVAVASSEAEAITIATEQAANALPEGVQPIPSEASAHSVRRAKLEQAAREVLGWMPPHSQPTS